MAGFVGSTLHFGVGNPELWQVSSKCSRGRMRVIRRRQTPICMFEKDAGGESLEQYARVEDARNLMNNLASRYEGGRLGLLRRLGTSAAGVIAETFTQEVNPIGVVICGKGDKGTVGFYTAWKLQELGYEITVLACESNPDFETKDVKEAGMSFLDFVPGPMDALYNFYVDAMLGLEYDNQRLDYPYYTVIEKIANSERPTISIDVPTGWHLEKGPKEEDLWRGLILKPDLLISLGIPKISARRFGGAFHYVIGNCFEEEDISKIGLSLPSYPKGSDWTLVGGNPALFGWGKKPGEVYGVEGAFMATMFPHANQSKRNWVDIDDNPDLWDELD